MSYDWLKAGVSGRFLGGVGVNLGVRREKTRHLTGPLVEFNLSLVGPEGFEPSTCGLKGPGFLSIQCRFVLPVTGCGPSGAVLSSYVPGI